MNEKFLELPEEKRLRIINAGFEVFSQNEYKKASTEDIAVKAGISKGLLFYYFHDKKSLFLYLYEYSENMMRDIVLDEEYLKITDIFDLFEYAAKKKYAVLLKVPHIMDFVMKAFYSQREDVTESVNERLQATTNEVYTVYLKNVDYSKFRDDVNPMEIIQMLTWIGDGFLHEKQRLGQHAELSELMEKFYSWTTMFKKMVYKEEYLK
jgi:AcrR family transcriptional regulator